MKLFNIIFNGYSNKNGKLLILLMNVISIVTIRSGKYTPYLILLFFLFILSFYSIVKNKIIIFYFLLFSMFLIYGILNFNDNYSILEDCFCFLPLILIFIHKSKLGIDLNKYLHIYLANSLVYLIPISLLIFKYMDYGFGSMLTTRFNYDESTNFELFSPIFPILFAPYLVFYFKKFNRREKLLINIANLFILIMGIITLSRSVVLSAIIPYIILYTTYILNLKINFFKLLFIIIISLPTIIFYINSNIYKNSLLAISVEGIQIRNESGYDRSDVTSGRFEETKDYLEQNLTFTSFFIGKGLGGHKTKNITDNYIGGINMIHIGPSHAFMKGGILLLILLYFPLLFSIVYFWNTYYHHYSLIMILFFISNIQTTNWGFNYGTLFFWLIISKLFQNIFSKSYNKNNLQID